MAREDNIRVFEDTGGVVPHEQKNRGEPESIPGSPGADPGNGCAAGSG